MCTGKIISFVVRNDFSTPHRKYRRIKISFDTPGVYYCEVNIKLIFDCNKNFRQNFRKIFVNIDLKFQVLKTNVMIEISNCLMIEH